MRPTTTQCKKSKCVNLIEMEAFIPTMILCSKISKKKYICALTEEEICDMRTCPLVEEQ